MNKEITQIAKEVAACAATWDPDVRLLGNATAGEIKQLCDYVRQAVKPEWYYNEDGEPLEDYSDLMLEYDLGEPVHLHAARSVSSKWYIQIPLSFDEDGDLDDWEIQSFNTQQEALEAFKKAMNEK